MRAGLLPAALLPLALAAASWGCARRGAAPAAAVAPGTPTVRAAVVVTEAGLAPEVIRAPVGSRVVLEFRIPREEHGFFVHDRRIGRVGIADHQAEVVTLAGGDARAEFFAGRPGEILVRCSRHGGDGCVRARGRLVVGPEADAARGPVAAAGGGSAPAMSMPGD